MSFKQAILDQTFAKKGSLVKLLQSNFLTETFIDFEDANFSFEKVELHNTIVESDTLIEKLF